MRAFTLSLILLVACAHAPAPQLDTHALDIQMSREMPREEEPIPSGVRSWPNKMANKMMLASSGVDLRGAASASNTPTFTGTAATVVVAVSPQTACYGFGGAVVGESCINSGSFTLFGDASFLRIYYGNQVRLTNSIASGAWITPYAFETSAAVTAFTMTDVNGTSRVAWGNGVYINATGGTLNSSAGITATAGGFTARNATAQAQVGTASNAFWIADAAGQYESTAFIAYQELPTVVSIANNAVGASPATYTSTFSESDASVSITCNDPDGCNVTLTETSILDGQRVCYVNVSANTVNFADTAGVSEIAGAFAAGQWDSICLQYRTDRWVELSRSNN